MLLEGRVHFEQRRDAALGSSAYTFARKVVVTLHHRVDLEPIEKLAHSAACRPPKKSMFHEHRSRVKRERRGHVAIASQRDDVQFMAALGEAASDFFDVY